MERWCGLKVPPKLMLNCNPNVRCYEMGPDGAVRKQLCRESSVIMNWINPLMDVWADVLSQGVCHKRHLGSGPCMYPLAIECSVPLKTLQKRKKSLIRCSLLTVDLPAPEL